MDRKSEHHNRIKTKKDLLKADYTSYKIKLQSAS